MAFDYDNNLLYEDENDKCKDCERLSEDCEFRCVLYDDNIDDE